MKKRIISVLLAAVMALALTVPAMAAEPVAVQVGSDEIEDLSYDEESGSLYYYDEDYNRWYVIPSTGRVISNAFYEGGYFITWESGATDYLYGLVKPDGASVLPCEYTDISVLRNGLIYGGKYTEDGNWVVSIFNSSGETVASGGYDAGDLTGEYAYFMQDPYTCLILDRNGTVMGTYSALDTSGFSEGFLAVTDNGVWMYLDANLKPVLTVDAEEIWSFSEGLASIRKDGKYGFIDKTGAEVIPCQYDYAGDFYVGCAMVQKENGGEYSLIDTTGKVLLSGGFSYMTYLTDDLLVLEEGAGNRSAVYSVSAGKYIIPFEYNSYEIVGNLIMAWLYSSDTAAGKAALFTLDGTLVREFQTDTGYIQEVSPGAGVYLFTSYDENGCSVAVFDKNGNEAFGGKTFDDASPLRNGMIMVQADGLYGVYKTDGTVVLPVEYDYISDAEYY